jgi:hypothetical protein
MRFQRERLFVGNIGFDAVARLRDGITMKEASADLARLLPMAWEKFPGGPTASSSKPDMYTAVLQPFRAEGKETEMAARTAIGASGRRIGWETMKESLLLGLLGGAGGLALADAGLRILVAMGPGRLPRLSEVSLSPVVLLFTLGISLGAGAFFGMFPILRRRRKDVVDALKQGGQAGLPGGGGHRAQNTLAVIQVALALVLLVASGLMLRSFQSRHNPWLARRSL